MKKTFVTVFSLLLAFVLTLPVFAAGADLAGAGESDMQAFAEEIKNGRHLFDTVGALSEKECEAIEEKLQDLERQSGQSAAIVIVENNEISEDLEKYADHLYEHGGLGRGSGRDGVLLVLDLGDEAHRGVEIYAQGGAMRYFTDRAIDQILDDYHGGIMTLLGDGDWYGALDRYTDAAEALYAQGVGSDQYNYNEATGEKDYYYKKQRSVKIWHVIVSLLAAGLAGLIPMLTVRSRYAMRLERIQAQSLNLQYRATSSFAFTSPVDTLIGSHTVHVPVPRPREHSHTGGGSFGGGRSTMHSSGGGGFHTSGGRKF